MARDRIIQVVSPPPVALTAHYAYLRLPGAFRDRSAAIIRDAELVRTSRPVVAFLLRRGEYSEGVETECVPAVYCPDCCRLEAPTDFDHQDETHYPQWVEPLRPPGEEPDPAELEHAELLLRSKAALQLIEHRAEGLRLSGSAVHRVLGVVAVSESMADLTELWALGEIAGLRIPDLRGAFTARRLELETGTAA